jgi:hypothetical protein
MCQNPLGIYETASENNIMLFPNPANNYIEIETDLKDYSISIFDVMGKLMLKEKNSQNKTRIDISDFSIGIYFIQLQSGEKILNKKFIKE